MNKFLVNLVSNASAQSGVGHHAAELAKRLKAMPDVSLTQWNIQGERGKLLKDDTEVATLQPWPGMLGSKSVNWIRLGGKISAGPVAPAPPPGGAVAPAGGGPPSRHPQIFHLTNQSLSFLAKRLSPSVVTVHDLIELLEPQDWKAQWLNAYLHGGITKANHIICVSDYTKKMVQQHCNVPEEKITVIPNGVGPEFHLIPDFMTTVGAQALRSDLKIPSGARIVLYVGSDHTRKNVVGAIQAFAKAQESVSAPLVFLKVGAPGLPAGREKLLSEIDHLHLREAVRFIDSVSTPRLNDLYNLADVLIYPSRYEGFGLPVLQAFATSTPVVTSTATSIPEVAGDAALMCDPDDIEGLAAAMTRIFTDTAFATQLQQKGLQRAQEFSWERAATQTHQVYAHTLS